MKKFILVSLVLLTGCAPGHKLKEVLHHPELLVPAVTTDMDNPIVAADNWIKKNLW